MPKQYTLAAPVSKPDYDRAVVARLLVDRQRDLVRLEVDLFLGGAYVRTHQVQATVAQFLARMSFFDGPGGADFPKALLEMAVAAGALSAGGTYGDE